MTQSRRALLVTMVAAGAFSIAPVVRRSTGQDLDELRAEILRSLDPDEFTGRVVANPPIQVRGMGAASVFRARVSGVVVVFGKGVVGTGALLNRQGDILTNEHVVRAAHRDSSGERVCVCFREDVQSAPRMQNAVEAKVVMKDQAHDLAIVRVSPPVPADAVTLPLAPDGPDVGEDVFAIGHPRKAWWNLTIGTVSKIWPELPWKGADNVRRVATIIQTQAPANPGSSGGPLLNRNGEIVGVVTFSDPGSQGFFFAVDREHARRLVAAPGPEGAPRRP